MTTLVPHQLLDIPTLEIVNRRNVGGPYAIYPASWSNVELNTILTDEIGGVSMSGSHQIVGLPAGKYIVSGALTHYNSNYTQARLYDVTNANELARSLLSYSVASDGPNLLLGPRKITIPTTATVAYQVLATAGLNDGNLSAQAAHSFADYASIRFVRVS